MKSLCVVVLFAVGCVVNAELPLRRRFQRIEQAPYPPGGFKPNQPFLLPQQQAGYPNAVYGPPQNGNTLSEAATTEDDSLATTETSTAENPPARAGKLKEREELSEDVDTGTYYIYHPSGLFQKIVYNTRNDAKNMAYRADFKYQDVEPIVDPIYTYDPETLLLRQVLV